MSAPSPAKSSLFAFLNARKAPKGSPFTHTSLAHPTGTFFIPPEDQLEFNRLYKSVLTESSTHFLYISLHLTERPPSDASPLIIDIDLRYGDLRSPYPLQNQTPATQDPQSLLSNIKRFTDADITTLIKLYHTELLKHYPVPKETRYFVTYKPGPRVEPHTIKDGFHIISPDVVIPLSHQLCLRDRIVSHPECIALFKDTLRCSNDINDVIDKSVYKSQWFLYGSGKENAPPHRVKRCGDITNPNDMSSSEGPHLGADTNMEQLQFTITNARNLEYTDADYFDLLSLRSATPRTPLQLTTPWSQPQPLPPAPSPARLPTCTFTILPNTPPKCSLGHGSRNPMMYVASSRCANKIEDCKEETPHSYSVSQLDIDLARKDAYLQCITHAEILHINKMIDMHDFRGMPELERLYK